jgi:dTDP-4-dehydrorhamnose reductase
MARIGILGSTGMLGSALTKELTTSNNEVVEFNRKSRSVVPGNKVISFDVSREINSNHLKREPKFDYIINAIGLIKQRMQDESVSDREMAFLINSDLPAFLNDFSVSTSTPIIQIGTDCVFRGDKGNYDETSEFDCNDLYGLSKVNGESRSQSLMTIRSSIIGHEISSKVSLLDWFLSQNKGANVRGYTNHFWNGVTTMDFARVVDGVIKNENFSSGVVHLVPRNHLSKFELLKEIARSFDRTDIHVEPANTEISVDRTLSTIFQDKNSRMWTDAGYSEPPTIEQMVKNYAKK